MLRYFSILFCSIYYLSYGIQHTVASHSVNNIRDFNNNRQTKLVSSGVAIINDEESLLDDNEFAFLDYDTSSSKRGTHAEAQLIAKLNYNQKKDTETFSLSRSPCQGCSPLIGGHVEKRLEKNPNYKLTLEIRNLYTGAVGTSRKGTNEAKAFHANSLAELIFKFPKAVSVVHLRQSTIPNILRGTNIEPATNLDNKRAKDLRTLVGGKFGVLVQDLNTFLTKQKIASNAGIERVGGPYSALNKIWKKQGIVSVAKLREALMASQNKLNNI